MSKKITLPEKELIYDLYINQNMNSQEVCEKLNISSFCLSKCLSTYNIRKSTELISQCRQKTNIEKYGVSNAAKADIVKEKIGKANKLNAKDTVIKAKHTKLIKYGNPNYNNIEKNKETKIINHSDPYYNGRDKYKQTMLDKYGVDNSFKLKKTKDNNIISIINSKGYNKEFEELISNREKSIAFLKDKNLSYYDLVKIFNAPYYVIQNWVTRLDLKDYISYIFTARSHYEDEICDYLKSIGVNKIEKNIKLLGKEEADIFVPDNNLIIEFDGTYWHSDLFKDKNYHLNKSLLAEKLGYRLIHIYEYEWEDKTQQEKIKQLLRISCGKVLEKIYARNCDIRVIRNKEAKLLNDKVHLQNHRNAKVTYGLFYHNELVQLMSFSKRKKGSANDWEIIRGCPGSNNIVIGGVSKLFKHFIKDYNPDSIFSYCDFNKFNGKSYEELGMKYIGNTGPDITYVINSKIVKRQYSNYKNIKDKVDYRIWGAGSKKYLWKK